MTIKEQEKSRTALYNLKKQKIELHPTIRNKTDSRSVPLCICKTDGVPAYTTERANAGTLIGVICLLVDPSQTNYNNARIPACYVGLRAGMPCHLLAMFSVKAAVPRPQHRAKEKTGHHQHRVERMPCGITRITSHTEQQGKDTKPTRSQHGDKQGQHATGKVLKSNTQDSEQGRKNERITGQNKATLVCRKVLQTHINTGIISNFLRFI